MAKELDTMEYNGYTLHRLRRISGNSEETAVCDPSGAEVYRAATLEIAKNVAKALPPAVAAPVGPIINLNGTSREALMEQYVKALDGLYTAQKAVQGMSPHGRDYPGAAMRFRQSQDRHIARLTALENMRKEIQAEAESL